MASAAVTAPQTGDDVNKNAYIECISKKARALRKKLTKITATEAELAAGKTLNADQLESIKRKSYTEQHLKEYEEVIRAMEAIELDAAKQEKVAGKQHAAEIARARKEQADALSLRHIALTELLYIVSLQGNTAGASLLTTLELTERDAITLNYLQDALFPQFNIERSLTGHATDIAAHLNKLLDASNDIAFGDVSYVSAVGLLQRIKESRAFNLNAPEPVPVEAEFVVVSHEDVADAPVETVETVETVEPPAPRFSFMNESELDAVPSSETAAAAAQESVSESSAGADQGSAAASDAGEQKEAFKTQGNRRTQGAPRGGARGNGHGGNNGDRQPRPRGEGASRGGRGGDNAQRSGESKHQGAPRQQRAEGTRDGPRDGNTRGGRGGRQQSGGPRTQAAPAAAAH